MSMHKSFRLMAAKLGEVGKVPMWLLYRFRHSRQAISPAVQVDSIQINLALESKERSIRQIIETLPGASFLEIGIGGGGQYRTPRANGGNGHKLCWM